jgi:uncharacterized protein DUF4333
MPFSRWSRVLGLFLAGCSFQASCGSRTLDMDNARKFVVQAMTGEVGAAPDEVVCPDKVKIEQGGTFDCTARYGKATATLTMRQNDEAGNVTVVSISGILIMKKAEAAIAEQFGKAGSAHVTVDCGDRVRPAVAGDKLTCKATDENGATATVEVTVKDKEGNIGFKALEGGEPPAQ